MRKLCSTPLSEPARDSTALECKSSVPFPPHYHSASMAHPFAPTPVPASKFRESPVWLRNVVRPRHHLRAAFTVIELLVVMGVVSLLASLLLPAVQEARGSARRIECSNRLRQVGAALHQFAATHDDRFPSLIEPYRKGHHGPSIDFNCSAQTQLLPYLDRGDLWRRFDARENGDLLGYGVQPPGSRFNPSLLHERLTAFECPADTVPPGGTSFRMCWGSKAAYSERKADSLPPGTDAALTGVAASRSLSLRKISDGLSNTACFSERVVGDGDSQRYDPWRDRAGVESGNTDFVTGTPSPDEMASLCGAVSSQPSAHQSYDGWTWLLTSMHTTVYNHVLAPNSRTPDCAAGHTAVTARSYHAGGVNLLMCDGAVRFVGESIDLHVWRAIASCHGGEVVGEF